MREYDSIWTGSSENSLVQLKDLEACRVISQSEASAVKGNHEYIISVDVARSERKQSATTAIAVFKIIDRGNGKYMKHLVHLETYNKDMHFEAQSIYVKEMVEKYGAKMVVIDGNGLGRGLLDYLVKEDKYPSYSVVNDDGTYAKYKLPNSLPLIFNVMSNTKETKATNIYNHFMAIIANHDLKLLVSEATIRDSARFRNRKDHQEQSEVLKPYTQTNLLVEEIMNLKFEARGNNTVISRVSKKMDKDRFSAVSYGLYYIYLVEQKNQQRKRETIDISGFMAVKKPKYKVRGWN